MPCGTVNSCVELLCGTKYDVSVNDIGHAWQDGFSNTTMANVNVLSEMIRIRNGFNICKILIIKILF